MSDGIGKVGQYSMSEETLREELERYRALCDVVSEAIALYEQGQTLDVNDAFCRMFDYTSEEAVGRSIYDFTPSEDLKTFSNTTDATDESFYEGLGRKKDGTIFPLNISARTTRFKGREVRVVVLRDLTRQKEVEKEAEKNRQDYENLLNSIDGVVWEAMLNPPRYTFVSKKAERMLGYPVRLWLEDINFWRKHIHPEDKEELFSQINQAITDQQTVGVEYRIMASDGRIVWIRGRISVEAENGVVVKLRGVMVDTTERRLAENELRKMHRVLLDSQQIAHWGSFEWELDEEGNITDGNVWSDELYRIFGLDPKEKKITYQDFISLVHPDDREDVCQTMRKTIHEGTDFLSHHRIIKPDGELRYLITRGSLLKDKNGKPVRLVGASSDITEQKIAEDALRASELRYRAFIENSSEGISRYDVEPPMPLDLPREEQIKYLMTHAIMRECNMAIAKMQNFDSVEDILGLSLGEIVKRRGEENYDALRLFVYSDYYVADVETKTVTKSKTIRYFLVNFVGVVESGKLIRGWGTQREITKRKHAELKLEAYSKQLRLLSARIHAAREEESAHIAREIHDELGTALTGLKWDLEWIQQKLNDSSDAETIIAVQERIHLTNRLIDNTVQTVRRISSELRPKLLDDLGLVAAIDWYAKQFEKRTGLNCKVDSQLEDIELNKEKATATFRIFQEILTNIMRHSGADTVSIYVDVDGDEFLMVVQDNGKGISEFDRQNTSSLGLLGMRERAYLVGGKVEIVGQEGRGTTVEVRIPV